MGSQGAAYILPPGSIPRVKLSGDELRIDITGYAEDGNMVSVMYPDGYRKFHQAATVTDLLAKVSGQLKTRYNVDSFEIKAIPESLSGSIILGGIKYA